MLHIAEKGGKSREIPVRHDVQEYMNAYIDAAGLRAASKDTPLLQRAIKRQRRLSGKALDGDNIYRMMNPISRTSICRSYTLPGSFLVTTITDSLAQGVPREDVQNPAGHADPRTTNLYDRTRRKGSRNTLERPSV